LAARRLDCGLLGGGALQIEAVTYKLSVGPGGQNGNSELKQDKGETQKMPKEAATQGYGEVCGAFHQ
jgi:hypothetical protein